jgi:hypothetical protein
LPTPTFIQGYICHAIPKSEAYDIVVSWSTFEHFSEPKIALQNAIRSLRPVRVLYIGIHLYTSNSGHHDLRAFTGFPLPFWAHLRASTSHLILPSSYLNEWRLSRVAIAFSTRSQRVQGISRILRFRTRLDIISIPVAPELLLTVDC